MPAHRRTLALSAAAAALAWSAPAFAEPDDYEYAQPMPQGSTVYHHGPVPPLPEHSGADDAIVIDEHALPTPPLGHPAHPYGGPFVPAPMMNHGPMMHHGPMPYPMPHHAYASAIPPRFDREEWLDECRMRIRGVDRKDRGGVIGGLLGGIAGGVIGNRAWDSRRTAGTLIGAGVGGLAGIAIGAAIGAASERRRDDECAWHLDRYMAGGFQQPGYGYGAAGYGYGFGGYTLMPVVVAVPQRQVIRETVTEEYIDEPVRVRSLNRSKAVHRSAPTPDKRVRYIKGK